MATTGTRKPKETKGRAQKPLKFRLFVNGQQVEKLTEEQCDRLMQQLSERMSEYYTQHPDQYERLLSLEWSE